MGSVIFQIVFCYETVIIIPYSMKFVKFFRVFFESLLCILPIFMQNMFCFFLIILNLFDIFNINIHFLFKGFFAFFCNIAHF